MYCFKWKFACFFQVSAWTDPPSVTALTTVPPGKTNGTAFNSLPPARPPMIHSVRLRWAVSAICWLMSRELGTKSAGMSGIAPRPCQPVKSSILNGPLRLWRSPCTQMTAWWRILSWRDPSCAFNRWIRVVRSRPCIFLVNIWVSFHWNNCIS